MSSRKNLIAKTATHTAVCEAAWEDGSSQTICEGGKGKMDRARGRVDRARGGTDGAGAGWMGQEAGWTGQEVGWTQEG